MACMLEMYRLWSEWRSRTGMQPSKILRRESDGVAGTQLLAAPGVATTRYNIWGKLTAETSGHIAIEQNGDSKVIHAGYFAAYQPHYIPLTSTDANERLNLHLTDTVGNVELEFYYETENLTDAGDDWVTETDNR